MVQHDFDRVYEENKEMVWKLASRYALSQPDREDLFQEVFLRVHKALPKFRGEAELKTWIFRIAVNTSISHLKKQKRYKKLKEILERFRVVEVREQEEANTTFEKLSRPLSKLNPLQRMILILADVQEKELKEIAQILKLPLGTVKSNLHRAREIVKNEVMKDDGL